MGDSTPIFGLRFPVGSDSPPDVPADMAELAQDVEDTLSNGAGFRSHGKSIVSAEQSTTSTSYTLLGAPDRVQNIVLPTDGLIFVMFRALMADSLSNGRAAIFLGSNQVKSLFPGQPPPTTTGEARLLDGEYQWVVSSPVGLAGGAAVSGGASLGGVTTGMALGTRVDPSSPTDTRAPAYDVGQPCVIEAAAGTYDVSVRVKASSGATFYATERKLWVWSQAF